MKKVLKNFYVRGSLLVLLVFFVFYFVFSAAFSAFTPTIAQRVGADGAGGPIRLMIYIDNDGVVQDVSALSHSEPLGRGDQYLSDACLFFCEGYSSYGYFDGGSGSYVFDKFDDTNLAIGKMLMGAVEQFRMLGAA